jgi:hypothetical protein
MQFKFVTGGALAALAAALALAAVPAQAREAEHNRNHGQHQQSVADNGQRSQRWAGRQQPTARPERAAPQAQRQRNWTSPRQQEPREQRSYTPRTRSEQPQQRSWTRQARPEQQRSSAQGQQTRQWSGETQRTERNRTYTNRDRSTTYGTSNWRDSRRDNDRNWRDGRRDNDRNWRDGNRDGRRWDRSWHNNNRYDWRHYRSSNRNVFHIGRYYSPYRNYSYRRLSIGFGLDSLFYSSRYWINDPWQYRLPEAYGPYRWVRYYDDALLVDLYTGDVVDVIYDFFW